MKHSSEFFSYEEVVADVWTDATISKALEHIEGLEKEVKRLRVIAAQAGLTNEEQNNRLVTLDTRAKGLADVVASYSEELRQYEHLRDDYGCPTNPLTQAENKLKAIRELAEQKRDADVSGHAIYANELFRILDS